METIQYALDLTWPRKELIIIVDDGSGDVPRLKCGGMHAARCRLSLKLGAHGPGALVHRMRQLQILAL